MKTIEIIEKDYFPEQQKILNIFKQYDLSATSELPVIFKMPRVPKQRCFINRIPCKTIGGKDL